ncbi:MAG: glycosyltransferase family 9 protein [Calditrichaeota bacterium]|nr:glycosyltransferase family 9 protein [Calditrichota bacterium]
MRNMKLLVVKLHALGDLVIITPAIKRLRDGFPDAMIDLLTTDWAAPAVVSNPRFDQIYVESNRFFFDPGIKSVVPLVRLVKKLRGKNYDAAVVFHSNLKIHTFVRAFGITKTFKFRSAANAGNFINGSENSIPLDEERHSALTAWELADLAANKLSGKSIKTHGLDNLHYEWYIQESESAEAMRILELSELKSHNFAVVMPGGGVNPNSKEMVRRWDSEKFANLIFKIQNEHETPVVIMGGKSDIVVCQDVKKRVDGLLNKDGWGNGHTNRRSFPLDWSGEHDLRIAAAIMNEAKFVITNDTGPLHIAGALGVPTIGIFGPTGYRLKLPPGKNCFSANTNLPCSPCYFSSFKNCIFDNIRCMDQLEVKDVMKVIGKALKSSAEIVTEQDLVK